MTGLTRAPAAVGTVPPPARRRGIFTLRERREREMQAFADHLAECGAPRACCTLCDSLVAPALTASGSGGGSAFEGECDLWESTCHSCGVGGDLVCCDECPKAWHASCVPLGIPAWAYEDGAVWACPSCVREKRKSARDGAKEGG